MANEETGSKSTALPTIERRKLEPIRRSLTVKDVLQLSPLMTRVTLTGNQLAGFDSPSPDDHIKVFFPTQEGGVEARDYTPRRFNAEDRTLVIDFVLHDGGAGSTWARQAVVGDRLQIGGPRGSTKISASGAWWLLIGDETALPSVGRRLEEMVGGTRVISVLAVAGPEEEQVFETKANLTTHWIHRPHGEAGDPANILKSLSEVPLPDGSGFIWIAAEDKISRAVRSYFVDSRGYAPEWVKASAYWSQ